jgi:hypothetical protein
MGVKRVWKFEGPAAVAPLRWYLELTEGFETPFSPHDVISEEQYEAAPPQTKRNIDQLVERGVLVASEEE